ncbi:hypothetical protein JKF63_07800 [Porcisia hertigi]|uniref:Uncharacterized protein n=1 Tax=Porcisia hertigi TaxID=2761500 RepID=A0A836LMG7_9TRYP|nr:hypothetical protein JKF63_07800 [Porcisia hertigi]
MKPSSRGHHDNVTRLTEKGFSKTKAIQALKDAGNNLQTALLILERQRDQELKQQQRSRGVKGACTSSGPLSAAIPSLQRTKPPPASSLLAPSPVTETLRKQQKRHHPCVVQFGSCQFGERCLFRDMPGDVCINHIRGSCIYENACRRRHMIDGVDIRNYVWDSTDDGDSAEHLRSGDVLYRVHAVDGMGSKVQVAEVIHDEADACAIGNEGSNNSGSVAHAQLVAPPPLASDFNRLRGSAPSYTEPMLPSSLYTFEVKGTDTTDNEEVDQPGDGATRSGPGAEVGTHPTPFLDLLKNMAGVAQSPSLKITTPPTSSLSSFPPAQTTPARLRRAHHPCVEQYGSCKYGKSCAYIDRDADVCVHFLRGVCRYSADDCHYRHETEEEFNAKLIARSAPAPWAVDVADTGRDLRHTRTPRNRLQDGFFQTATASVSGRDTLPGGSSPSRTLPSGEDLAMLSEALRPANPAATENNGDGDGGDFISASEFDIFVRLLGVFPDVKPVVVLQALRMSCGDPVSASDIVARLDAVSTTADVDDVAAALALAAAEEAEASEEASANAAAAKTTEHHNALLTLVSLFPAVEPTAIEVVLSQHHGVFSESYNALLCAQERVARSAIWNGSTTTMAPADQLRVEKLCAMFPGLDADVVRCAFCSADCQWKRAITALNDLTKEMLHFESTVTPVVPEGTLSSDAVVLSGQRSCSTATTAVAAAAAAAGDTNTAHVAHEAPAETSAEAYNAYLAAEKEILAFGDWRRVREQACLVQSQRCRVLGQASAAFVRGDGRTAKLLSCEGHRLGLEYNRLNRLAMLALEHERLRADATSTLDLHGFYTYEVHDVLVRRIHLCQNRRIGQLRIVTGEGKHSKRGCQSLYPTVMEDLRTDSFLTAAVKVKSIKAGYIDVTVRLPTAKA